MRTTNIFRCSGTEPPQLMFSFREGTFVLQATFASETSALVCLVARPGEGNALVRLGNDLVIVSTVDWSMRILPIVTTDHGAGEWGAVALIGNSEFPASILCVGARMERKTPGPRGQLVAIYSVIRVGIDQPMAEVVVANVEARFHVSPFTRATPP